MQTATILYIILAGIIALSLALFQYIYKSKKRTKTTLVLTFLRFLTVFSILILLINPKFDKITYINEKPSLVVAIDNSESVSYLKQDNNVRNVLNTLQSSEELNERFNVEYYQFGKDVTTTDSLSFSEDQTNPALLFDRLSQVYENQTAPVLFMSDGNQTYGNDYEFYNTRFKQTVYPIILGDTTQYTDVKIQQLNVNKYAYLKNQFPVEVIVVSNTASPINTEFRVTSGNATIFSKRVDFTHDNSSQIINFKLPASRVGVNSYRAELLPIENEKNVINNVKNFAVEVIDQKTTVAIVSDIIHPDLGALKKSIESNEQRTAVILKPKEFTSQLNGFQLAILYQPNNNFKLVYDEVSKANMNIFVISGTKTIWSALHTYQSFYKQTITNQTEDFQPNLNLNYATFIIDDLDFSSFPPLKSEFGETKFTIPNDVILNKSINGIQLNEALLTTFEVGERREAFLNGEGLWKWRAQSYLNDKSFTNFDNFIGKLVQYLSSYQKKSRLNVDYESFYDGNDNVKINAQYFNKNYEFDATATLNITLKNKDTEESTTFPFILRNTSFEVDLSGLSAGDYSFTVSVANEAISKSGELKILDYNVEQQFLNANVSKLKTLADKSNGAYYFIDDTSMLIDNLINDERYKTVQRSSKNVVPLIDWKFLLAIIAFSLSAEWFIRKYNGLI